jgi:hypothetical protein
MAIFSAAIGAHRRGDYELSVPALLPHIEGIGHEFVDALDSVFGYNGRVLAELLGYAQEPGAPTAQAESYADALYAVFFASYDPRQPYEGTLVNRHAIFHGRLVDSGTEANSLRSFLALDGLHHFLSPFLTPHTPSLVTARQGLKPVRQRPPAPEWLDALLKCRFGASAAARRRSGAWKGGPYNWREREPPPE